ncbi:hypothetical protein niasHT_038917 [Heterodera trifolii]|uniref:Uncharacterized protein n=1 Tax=Heterodera trifolii TaxID=157864 RepID=A0ABD2IRL9_9BILA
MLLMCTIWQMSTDQTVHLTDGGGGFKEVKILTLAQCHANNGPKETANKPYGIEFRLPRKGGNCDDGIHLTDGGGGFKEVQLHSLAQCNANNGSKQTANKPYGIEFRLSREGGNCDDGILICYPAILQRGDHLDTNRNSKVKRKFFIGANMGNSIAEECVQKMAKNGHKNGAIIWRGLKLRTMPKQNDQNNERIILLETSIASQKYYPLGAGQLKISVLFASNQTAVPFTRFSLEENDLDGRAMQNDFLRLNGPSFLSDYADLWLLGIDMLPMAHQTEEQREQLKMKLFIHRSSNCFMEAWFVQPDQKMTFDGSVCKPNPTEDEYERLFPKKVDKYVFPTGGSCAGLGNQMFRFAALYGIGKPYGRKPIYKGSQKCKKSHVNAFGHQLCLNVTAFKNEFFGNDQSHKFCVHTRRGDIIPYGWGSKEEPTEKGIDFGFEYLRQKFDNISISVVLLGEDKQFLANLSFNQQDVLLEYDTVIWVGTSIFFGSANLAKLLKPLQKGKIGPVQMPGCKS